VSAVRVFVTGATGFLGQALVRALTARGDEVVAWVRDLDRARPMLGEHVTLVTGPSVDGCDGVVNLAGAPVAVRWTPERKRDIHDSRIGVTDALVAAIKTAAKPPAVLVSASAIGYYGDGKDALLEEDAAPGTDFLATICKDWEAAALAAPATVRVVRPRIGIVLGKGGGALEKMLPPFKAGLGGPIAGGKQWMSWIHVADMVAIFLRALDDPRVTGALNATAPAPASNREFVKALGHALHRRTVFGLPGFVVKLAFGEGAKSLFLAGQRAVPRALEQLGFQFQFANLDAALADLVAA
jgi:uncharacterized protein (TIGR01777 family)